VIDAPVWSIDGMILEQKPHARKKSHPNVILFMRNTTCRDLELNAGLHGERLVSN
jgi:hypothetical protein